MRARFTLLQAFLGLLSSFFSGPSRAAETPEDLPWAEVSRSLEKVNDANLIRKTLERELPGFLGQLEADARNTELLSLWGLSRNVDESHLSDRQKTVPAALLKFFNSILKLPYDANFEVGHAGLTHTYGYLFSTLQTPYGFKRARYVRGEIEKGFGLPAGVFSGRHSEGSLLMNLTLFAGPIAFRQDPVTLKKLETWKHQKGKSSPRSLLRFDFSKVHPKTLVETVKLGTTPADERIIEFHTDLVPFTEKALPGGNAALLIHSMKISRPGHTENRLITVFPVGAAFADSLFDPKTLGDAVAIKLRYNAMLPDDLLPTPADLTSPAFTGKRSILP